MVVFPNCKLNLGLYVTRKRNDGYHDLLTCFYPLNWCDALEVTETKVGDPAFSFVSSGRLIAGGLEENLIYKCWQIIQADYQLPPLSVHLHKNIPMGAGLGGGSSDAAFFLNLLDQKFELKMAMDYKMQIAAKLGSDCPFFLLNKPVQASGRGEIFQPSQVSLHSYFILCIFPEIHSNTRLAFAAIQPRQPIHPLVESLQLPIEQWASTLFNDFEEPVFSQHPILRSLKESLYKAGALYASMSGSGSAIYGIFRVQPDLSLTQNYSYYLQKPQKETL